jgi:hypothetical protein
MKNLKKIFFCLILVFGCVYSSVGGAPDQRMPKLLQLSPDEAEKMLEEINQWVSSQPPEFQEAFKSEVAKQQEIIGNMKSEDEFLNYVNDIERQMTGEAPEQPMPAPMPTPMVAPDMPAEEEEKAPEAVPTPVLKAQTAETARELLDEIVQLIDLVVSRARTVQNMPFRIKNWGTKGQIKAWRSEKGAFDWVSIQGAIEKLKAQLHKIKDNRYLGYLVEDKDLYRKLEMLRDTLYEYEPLFTVEKREMRAPHITAQASLAFRTILDVLNDNIFVFNLGKSIDALEEKYRPFAEQLKDEEEKKKKLALETGKRTYQATPTVVAGVPAHERYANSATYGYGTAPAPAPYYPPYPSYSNEPYPPYPAYDGGLTGPGSAGGSSATTGGKGTPSEEAKAAEEREKKSADDKKKKAGEEENGVKEEEFKGVLQQIDAALDEAADELTPGKDSNDPLRNIENYLRSPRPVDKKLVKKISNATSQMRIAVRKIKRLQKDLSKKKASQKVKRSVGQDFYENWDEENHKHIQNILARLEHLKEIDLSADKKYAFAGGKDKAAAIAIMPTIESDIPNVADVFELRNEIKNYTQAMRDIRGY